jgi:hypothetical protein
MSSSGYKVTKDELRERLRETVGHMLRSAAAYDSGDESEARRLAHSIRLLVKHSDKGQSKALLHQLGLLQGMSFLDTCGPIPKGNLMTESPMVLMEFGPNGGRFKPRLAEVGPWARPKMRLFAEWWNMPIIRNESAKVDFCRRELVLSVAEQDGGSHADPTLNAKYAALSRHSEFVPVYGRSGQTERPLRPIELAHVRQIAYEIIVTLTEKVPSALGDQRS